MAEPHCVVESPRCMLRAVNERTLLIVAALGAFVVAFAVYHLMTRDMGQLPEPVPVEAGATPSTREGPRPQASDRGAGTPSKPRVNAPVRTRRKSSSPGGPPPAVPMPDVSLEEAREDYDDLMAELGRELERNKETGKRLANKHWVEYYQRTHEVMNPLRRLLGSEDEDAKREVSEKDEALRTLMSDLQRDPAELE